MFVVGDMKKAMTITLRVVRMYYNTARYSKQELLDYLRT
jgi:predicted solute-binding protein